MFTKATCNIPDETSPISASYAYDACEHTKKFTYAHKCLCVVLSIALVFALLPTPVALASESTTSSTTTNSEPATGNAADAEPTNSGNASSSTDTGTLQQDSSSEADKTSKTSNSDTETTNPSGNTDSTSPTESPEPTTPEKTPTSTETNQVTQQVMVSPSCVATMRTSLTSIKTKGKRFELKGAAKQKLYGYDTLQGCCSDGTYGYYCLYNRKVEKCKIAKVKLSNMKVVKVSGVLAISHGNDITYNKHTKRLVVANCTGVKNRLSVVNASTLKLEKKVDVKAADNLKGATKSQARAIAKYGIAGIAYNASTKEYAALLKSSHNVAILNSSFKPVRYIQLNMKNNQLYQSIEVTSNRIYIVESFKSNARNNIVTTYNWNGKVLKRYNLGTFYELEGIYKVGNKYHAGFYRSFYVKKYRYKTVKKKYRTKSGKVRTKKVRKKVYYYTLQRENYLYTIKGL